MLLKLFSFHLWLHLVCLCFLHLFLSIFFSYFYNGKFIFLNRLQNKKIHTIPLCTILKCNRTCSLHKMYPWTCYFLLKVPTETCYFSEINFCVSFLSKMHVSFFYKNADSNIVMLRDYENVFTC